MSTTIENNPVENSIRKKLVNSLNPSHIEVINESYMHNVPKGSETHFKVVVVSDTFKDISRLKVRNLSSKTNFVLCNYFQIIKFEQDCWVSCYRCNASDVIQSVRTEGPR